MPTNKTHADALALRSNPPAHMSLKEAALYLGISPRKLWSESAKRQVKAARIGARLIFPRSELDRYVALKVAAGS